MTPLTRAERETIVRWSEDPTDLMTVYTHREREAKRLLRMGATLKRTRVIDGEVEAWTVECPREWFKWPRKPRKLEGEALAKAQERIKARFHRK